jgi:hypothetical protein
MHLHMKIRAGIAALVLAALACNVPDSALTPTPDAHATALAATLSVIQTTVAAPSATPTYTPTPLPESQKTTVIVASLCWLGPGPAYEVSSAIGVGQVVDLLGRDASGNWWIIRGPIYHDPCWVMKNTLRIDPSINVAALPIISPPPTPTPTPTNTPTPTPTP